MMIWQISFVLSLILSAEIMRGSAWHHHMHRNQPIQVPNKFRYAKISESIPRTEQIVDSYAERLKFDLPSNKYQIKRRDLKGPETISSSLGLLDNEDRLLLDRFYSDNMHDHRHLNGVLFDDTNSNTGLQSKDLLSHKLPNSIRWHQPHRPELHAQLIASIIEPISRANWTIDPYLLSLPRVGSPLSAYNYNMPPAIETNSTGAASYSPVHRLLTSYDPVEEQLRAAMDTNQERGARANRVSGATLHGRVQSAEPMMSSKSAENAIKLHDEMFENPPRDGIARVRMYFHRAIHDDVRLYGTGPWKYWGHGWGVEYGFDPKNLKNPSLYQKGYSIERAYGRDFCKDKKNCRPPDPNFFKEMPKPVASK